MAGEDRVLAGGAKYIDFQTDPSRYRHWKIDVDGSVAPLTMDVDENAWLFEGYHPHPNSYDPGVPLSLPAPRPRFNGGTLNHVSFIFTGTSMRCCRYASNVSPETTSIRWLTGSIDTPS